MKLHIQKSQEREKAKKYQSSVIPKVQFNTAQSGFKKFKYIRKSKHALLELLWLAFQSDKMSISQEQMDLLRKLSYRARRSRASPGRNAIPSNPEPHPGLGLTEKKTFERPRWAPERSNDDEFGAARGSVIRHVGSQKFLAG